jgi:hypothetical protein
MVSIKSTLKSVGVILICFCAIFLETLFISYRADIQSLDTSVFNEIQMNFYNAQVSMCNMMNIISLGILGLFSFILLFFSIERYIDENKANMGVLKALGYTKNKIAVSLMKFAIPTFVGCLLGYLVALIFSKLFYTTMNADHLVPDFSFTFRPLFFVGLIFIPTILVIGFSFEVGRLKLKGSPLDMINQREKNKKTKMVKENGSFLKELRSTMLKNHLTLIIFVAFATLCFSANVQMAFTMYHEANTSVLFFWMILGIGLLLGVTIMILAFRFVFQGNKNYMAMLKAYGYQDKECYYALYGGYPLVSFFSFLFGTAYQAILMSFMFKEFTSTYGIEYSFDFYALAYSLVIFILVYGIINIVSYIKIKKIPMNQLNVDLG